MKTHVLLFESSVICINVVKVVNVYWTIYDRVYICTRFFIRKQFFCNFKADLGKISFLKIAAEAFEARDVLNIFLRFWSFWGSFSYKKFSYEKCLVQNTEAAAGGVL